MKTIVVSNQEELDAITNFENNRVENNRVEIRNATNVITIRDNARVYVYDSSEVYANGSSEVYAYDSSKVHAYKSSEVYAYNSSKVDAHGSSRVEAYNSSEVKAHDSSNIYATNSSVVEANDSSIVYAHDLSNIYAYNSSKVDAHDSSKVHAYNSSVVSAYNSSKVEAHESSKVYAHDSSVVYAYNSSLVDATKSYVVYAYSSSIVYAFNSSEVYAHDSSRVEARDSSVVYAHDLSRVEAYASSVVCAYLNSTVHNCSVNTILKMYDNTVLYNHMTSTAVCEKSVNVVNEFITPTFDQWLERGKVVADGICLNYISHKTVGEVVIYTAKDKEDKTIYVARNNDKFSHGESIEQAIKDLRYKISDRDTSSFEKWNHSDIKQIEEIIEAYRVITGACEIGTKMFCDKLNLKEKYSIEEVFEITKGAYGADKFREFFKKEVK